MEDHMNIDTPITGVLHGILLDVQLWEAKIEHKLVADTSMDNELFCEIMGSA